MTTVTLPSDLESRLITEAHRRGETVEAVVAADLRRLYQLTSPVSANGSSGSLLDDLKPYVGAIAGSNEAFSENCGKRFADHLEQRQRGAS